MGEPAAPGIQIRLAGPGDAAALTELFDAVDRHYWGSAAPSPSAMAEHVRRRVLTATSCEIALAEMDGQAVGLATFAVLYPAPGPSGQLFMKDLFTVAAARGRGVGHALMIFLARLALERGCGRFDLTAETDNPEALAFYDRLGARRVEEKVYYRFDGKALRALADKA
ncbi:MAG TPA: GNAT family N-acetyltransferase [Dongiaceae bacterium]